MCVCVYIHTYKFTNLCKMWLIEINWFDSTNLNIITFKWVTKSKTKFKFGTLIILPAKIIHICSAPPECFTACLCQCSASTSCFRIDRLGCKWSFIQATWRNSQQLLCIVIIGFKGFPFQHTSEPQILGWKDWLLQLRTQRLKRKRDFQHCIKQLLFVVNSSRLKQSDHSYMHTYLLTVNQKIYYGYLRGFPALDIHEMWNVH